MSKELTKLEREILIYMSIFTYIFSIVVRVILVGEPLSSAIIKFDVPFVFLFSFLVYKLIKK